MANVGSVNDTERTYASLLESQKNVNSGSDLTMEDYLALIVAEMRTQDVLNPDSDTAAMVNQLVSMTTIQAMENMVNSTNAQYSASLVGKEVAVAAYDENGKYFQDTGVIQSVIMATDEPRFVINGKEYSLSNIMEVKQSTAADGTE